MEFHKILVVDDNVDNAERIIDYLNDTDKSFTFFQALNGKIALSLAEKKLPDLIITDWEMPVMDGIELIKNLKSIESTKDIPIIMCTGVMTETENLKTALDAGAVDYIRKPVEKNELEARVHSMLKLSESLKKVKSQNEELFLLNNTKNKFFSIISHDLRGPFGGIMGLSELLSENIKNFDLNEIESFVNLIYNSSKTVYSLLENLLDWSRSQMNKIEIKPEKIYLEQIIFEVVEILKNQANNKNISLNYDLKSSIQLITDKNILKTILRNLISNAIKFTRNSGIVTIQFTNNSSLVEITVKDNGVGMNSDLVNRLFKINEKVTNKGTADEAGTGLGLILCKEFVEKLGGKIWVESEEGKGSDFKFTIPICNDR